MEWNNFKEILLMELNDSYVINSKFNNMLENLYPLLKNKCYSLVEYALINTLSESNKWTVRDVVNSKFGTSPDLIFMIDKNEFPVSIKTNTTKKSGTQLLNSRTKVDILLSKLDSQTDSEQILNILFQEKCLNIPILSLDYDSGEMSLNIKEANRELYDVKLEWLDENQTCICKSDTHKTLLTISAKKRTIAAYDGFFQTTTLLKQKCSNINLIMYDLVKIIQSKRKNEQADKNF